MWLQFLQWQTCSIFFLNFFCCLVSFRQQLHWSSSLLGFCSEGVAPEQYVLESNGISINAYDILFLFFLEWILVCTHVHRYWHNDPHRKQHLHKCTVCMLHFQYKCVVCLKSKPRYVSETDKHGHPTCRYWGSNLGHSCRMPVFHQLN